MMTCLSKGVYTKPGFQVGYFSLDSLIGGRQHSNKGVTLAIQCN